MMATFYLILPLALVGAGVAVLAFVWAARDGQFDDLDTPARRVLFDDVPAPSRPRDPPRPDVTDA
jgi:cbb3-type cytochrome oxidase maturation protein